MAFTAGTLGVAASPNTQAFSANLVIGGVFNLSLAPAAIQPNTVGTLAVPNSGLGLMVNDFVVVSYQGVQTAGIVNVAAWVSASDTLNVSWGNFTATAATPVNGVYDVLVMRPASNSAQLNPAIQP